MFLKFLKMLSSFFIYYTLKLQLIEIKFITHTKAKINQLLIIFIILTLKSNLLGKYTKNIDKYSRVNNSLQTTNTYKKTL